MKNNTTTSIMFFNQYKNFRDAAERIVRSIQGQNMSQLVKLLNPIYLLLGHSLECLFKSVLPAGIKGHELKGLFEKVNKAYKISLSVEEVEALDNLHENYYPGTATNSVRYPLQGSKTFKMPISILRLFDTLETTLKQHIRNDK